MVTAAFTSGFDYLWPVRLLVVGLALWYFRRQYGRILRPWSWSWAAVAAGAAVFALWFALEQVQPGSAAQSATPDALTGLPASWAAGWLILRLVGYVVAVPLAEELAFRGYLTRRLISAEFDEVPPGRFTWFSFIASSAVFGVLHEKHLLAGMLAGMVFALALYRRGRVVDAVVAHATANGLLAACVLTTGNWALWG